MATPRASWERRILLAADGSRQGMFMPPGWGTEQMAGGTWEVKIRGLGVLSEPGKPDEPFWGQQCWSFAGGGTFLLQISLGNDPHPIVSLAGDDATPMSVVRETLETALRAHVQTEDRPATSTDPPAPSPPH